MYADVESQGNYFTVGYFTYASEADSNYMTSGGPKLKAICAKCLGIWDIISNVNLMCNLVWYSLNITFSTKLRIDIASIIEI